jgi:1-pyrroline-5-carboxylate dehydrogenase
VSTGPLINAAAVDRYLRSIEEIRMSGGTVLCGGDRLTDGDLARGFFVSPAVVEAPAGSRIWRDELFSPLVAVAPFGTFGEALDLANDSEYGLTAGLYSDEPAEIQAFLDRAEASVLYVNRRAGATTGAWPGLQPISGWKNSGNTGRGTAGPHYLEQYLREQSRTVIGRG